MSKVRVAAFSVSLDGFGAGVRQSLDNPLGVRMGEAFGWFLATDAFKKMHAGDDDPKEQHSPATPEGNGAHSTDNNFALRSFENVGAWILGRNMFGPVRGAWPDEEWKGWWGPNPPYHVPVFVLTHYARAPLEMEGGTTFHFVTDGVQSALRQAKDAAQGKDVRIGGGVATIRQYLQAGAIDELHLAVSPVLLGEGESLFAGIDLPKLGYRVVKSVAGEKTTHVLLEKDK